MKENFYGGKWYPVTKNVFKKEVSPANNPFNNQPRLRSPNYSCNKEDFFMGRLGKSNDSNHPIGKDEDWFYGL